MGKRLGYAMRDSVRGFSGGLLGLVMAEIILLLVWTIQKHMGFHVQFMVV
jgi:hypothetical protein